MFLRVLALMLLLLCQSLFSQENLSALTIPADLKENADAVIRLDQKDIAINSRRAMTIKTTRIVTVLNSKGLKYIGAAEYFDKSTSVKSIEAVIYDGIGTVLKKIKRKDFSETAVSEGSIITDNKLLSINYTPVQYPFTVVYTSEVSTSTTAFIPKWTPIDGLYASVERSMVNITYNKDLGFRYKEYNFGSVKLNKAETTGTLSLSAEQIPAWKSEDYLPSFQKLMPHVLFSLEKFNLEGLDGEAKDWQSFGSWMYTNLLTGTDELPESTIAAIKAKTAGETDLLKKAKIVYEYVQSKTRYISIQLGIGGWRPMNAKDVDRLGYGDCKALTNYTRALLKAVGVEAYYAVINAGNEKVDMRPDFVSMQGNHVILALPYNGQIRWLECTSQVAPFAFQGDFTDDRMALLVKPEGGELVKTTIYSTALNTQQSTGKYKISETGAILGDITIKSKGIQYDSKYFLSLRSQEDIDKFYKNTFSNINNLKLKKTNLLNNKDLPEFTEDLSIEAEGYCNKSGNKLILAVNAFNQMNTIPQRSRNRKNAFEISRGFTDTDEVTIDLPAGYTVEAKPENVILDDKFGQYKAEYTITDNKMVYKRTLIMNEGYYESSEYENYRLFREKIARNDNAKLVLVKN